MPPGSYNKEYWAQAGRIRPGSDASPSQDNTHTPIRTCGNSALPICRPVRFWITAENQRIQRKPTQTQGEHVNLHTDSNTSLGLNQALWHWRRNATRCPPCHPQQYSLNIYKLVDISLCHKTNYNFRPNSLRSKTKKQKINDYKFRFWSNPTHILQTTQNNEDESMMNSCRDGRTGGGGEKPPLTQDDEKIILNFLYLM